MNIRYRSYFWPAVLILAGVIALLVNTGAIPVDRLILLVNLWPVVLIVIGLEIVVRRGLQGTTANVAAAAVALVAVAGAAVYVGIGPSPLANQKEDVQAALGDLKQASLEVDVGSATVNVSGGSDLGADLYHAHIEFSGPKPDVSLDRSTGELTISQNSNYPFGLQPGQFNLTIQLSTEIPWTISENTGASRDTINIPQLTVSRIELNTGAAEEEITLGPPKGTVPIEVNGGALTVRVHRPSGVDASVAVSGGAISLNADNRSTHGIGELTWQSSGFSGATDAYRITVDGGACNVTVDNAGSD